MRVYASADELIGNTPLLRLSRLEKQCDLKANLFAKLECFNPGMSAKDRAAKEMLDEAERDGVLHPGSVIIEPTSGNTGIGLCAVAVPRGYRVVIVMPDSMSEERKKLIRAFGGELVLTDGAKGMQGAIDKAAQLRASIPGGWIAGQFTNPANPRAHYKTTGPEIWSALDGNVSAFVAGVGTGGTISGTGRFLKEKDPFVRIVGVEPAGSPVLSGGHAGKHGLQGIGAGFVPAVLEKGLLDEIIAVTEEDAYAAARLAGTKEGVLVGISGGAALHAALTLAKQDRFAGKNVVVLFPDSGERYLSTDLY